MVGENAANIYPKGLLFQPIIPTIRSSVFRRSRRSLVSETFFTNPHDFA